MFLFVHIQRRIGCLFSQWLTFRVGKDRISMWFWFASLWWLVRLKNLVYAYWLAIWILPFANCSFIYWVVLFDLCSVFSVLCILDINPLSVIQLIKICSCLQIFSSLNSSLCCTEFFINLSIVGIISWVTRVLVIKSLLCLYLEVFSLFISSKKFRV